MENEKLELIKALQAASAESVSQINSVAAHGYYIEGQVSLVLAIVMLVPSLIGGAIFLYGVREQDEVPAVLGVFLFAMFGLLSVVSFSFAIPYIYAPEAQLILDLAR